MHHRCFVDPAYGALLPWRRACPPTRRLRARITLPKSRNWEEPAGQASVVQCAGPLADVALRVRAITRGGCSLASAVVVAHSVHLRKPIEIVPPAMLPHHARALLTVEDLLASTARGAGLSADEQWELLRVEIHQYLFPLTQLFRLFAMAYATKANVAYTISRAQFRGLLVSLGVSPAPLRPEHVSVLFAKGQRAIKFEVALVEALAHEGTETRGHRSDRGLGITQFVGVMLRVAHAVYPHAHSEGVGAQFRLLMQEHGMPVHAQLAAPTVWDGTRAPNVCPVLCACSFAERAAMVCLILVVNLTRGCVCPRPSLSCTVFLRSRPAAAVYEAHTLQLRRLFHVFAHLDSTSTHAQVHCETINLNEWLTFLMVGGFFDDQHSVAHQATGSSGDELVLQLTHQRAIRIFVEANIEDIQLDLVKHSTEDDDLYSELVRTTPTITTSPLSRVLA